ncbi:MAG: DinB family protein [Vicinamibacterales bacterium]
MKQVMIVCMCGVFVASAVPVLAQSKALAEALKRHHDGVARNVMEAAEKMPEADYGFQATKDVRTFAGFVGHVANANYNFCARAKGEANPNKDDFEKVSDKAKLVAAMKAAVAYCEPIYAAQSDATLAELVSAGPQQVPRGAILIQNASHNNEHYGNIVTYMRLKGLVPPSTERAQTAKPPGR